MIPRPPSSIFDLRFSILLCVVCACLFRLAGCVAMAGAPQLRSVLPPVAPPKSVTITTTWTATVYLSPDLAAPFNPLTGFSTNRWQLPATNAAMFFAAVATNFPFTNVPVRVNWRTVADAMVYRIYFGDAATNWLQQVETPNRTQITTSLWKCFATNTVAMTTVNSNGVESAMSKIVKLSPDVVIHILCN